MLKGKLTVKIDKPFVHEKKNFPFRKLIVWSRSNHERVLPVCPMADEEVPTMVFACVVKVIILLIDGVVGTVVQSGCYTMQWSKYFEF